MSKKKKHKHWQFQEGNQLWRLAKNPGRKRKYTPRTLFKKAIEYFEHVDNTPILKKDALRSGQDAGRVISIPAQRPYTDVAFYTFAGIDRKTFNNYSKKDEFIPITTYITGVIRANQLEGAMVGIFNANIVARMQGLTERKTLEVARFLENMEDGDLAELAENILTLTDNETNE